MKSLLFIRRVHFHELDPLGIVHHSNIYKYFEEARMAFGREGNVIDENTLVRRFGLSFPVRRQSARFFVPLTAGLEVTIRTMIGLSRNPLLIFRQSIEDTRGKTMVVCETECVLFDRVRNAPCIEMPADLFAKLSEFAGKSPECVFDPEDVKWNQ